MSQELSIDAPLASRTLQGLEDSTPHLGHSESDGRRLAVEFCAGFGGIGIGLRALGFRIVRAYDAWSKAVQIYNHNTSEPVATVCDLVSEAGRAQVASDCAAFGKIELLAAGPPCKGFSQLRNGYHKPGNPHNRVLAAMPSFVAMVRPRLVLIENVPDLERHDGGKTFRTLMDALERPDSKLHYRVAHAVYDAALFGVPQVRRRLFILAVRQGDGEEHLPLPGPDLRPLFTAVRRGSEVPEALKPYLRRLEDPQDLSLTSAAAALSDLPTLKPGEIEKQRRYARPPANAYQRLMRANAPELLTGTCTPNVNETTLRRLECIPHGGCARDLPPELLAGLSRRYDSAYRRLHPGVPSTALSTKYDCIYHHKSHRSLSVREYARLQGIPDCIEFPASLACRREAYEMIGNSVPPLLVQGVVGALLRARASATAR